MRSLPMPAVLVLLLVTALLAPAAPAHAATGGATRVQLLALSQDGIAGSGSRTRVVGEGARLTLVPQLRWRWYGSQASLPALVLQRDTGGGWRRVRGAEVSLPAVLGDGRIQVRTPPVRARGAKSVVRFRLVSHPYADGSGEVTNRSVSRPLRVVVEDRSRYAGVRRTAWRAVRQYCPDTAIRLADLPGDRAGVYSTGTLLITLDRGALAKPDVEVRSIALHECAHQRQWLNYGATSEGWDALQAAAAAVYADDAAPEGGSAPWYAGPSLQPFDPVEHAADCASVAIEPAGYLGYGGWCTADELQEGARLMAGARY